MIKFKKLDVAPRNGEQPHEYLARVAMQCDGTPLNTWFVNRDGTFYLAWRESPEGGVAARGSVSPTWEAQADGY